MNELFEIKQSSDFGRYLVAKRNFNRGQTVFAEPPSVISPSCDLLDSMKSTHFVCIGCCKVILTKDSVHCVRCHWHACSQQCTEDLWHSNFECSIFEKYAIEPSIENLKYLFILRTVLIINLDDSKSKDILALSSSVEVEDAGLKAGFDKDTKDAFTFIHTLCGVPVNETVIKIVIKIFFVNAFGVVQASSTLYRGKALLSTSCLLPHSCSPNLDWMLTTANDEESQERWTMTLYARNEIHAGDVLSIPYTEDYMTSGTVERRRFIAKNYNFLCRCERCVDASELGTYFSAVMCRCSHVLLPEHPLDLETKWKCTNAACGDSMAFSEVEILEERFEFLMYDIIDSSRGTDCVHKLDALISMSSSTCKLHPNNNKVSHAVMEWLSLVDLDIFLKSGSRVDQMYKLISSRAKHCIVLWSKLGAVSNWITCQGILAKVIMKYRFKSKSGLSVEFNDYSLEDRLTYLNEIVELLRNAVGIMKRFDFEIHSLPSVLKSVKEEYPFWRGQLYNANHEAKIQDDYLEGDMQDIFV